MKPEPWRSKVEYGGEKKKNDFLKRTRNWKQV